MGDGVFRTRDPQHSLLESSYLLPEEKRLRLEKTWADSFRRYALPLIDESQFAEFYCQDNGAPNKPVQIVLGTLILKDLFDLTDLQALEQLEFNLLWQHALRLQPTEAHLCQKTLHNFRARLMASDGGKLVFTSATDSILGLLGTVVSRQRLDSTQILSNIARLTRLGLFCETIRKFLRSLRNHHRRLFKRVPAGLLSRYLKLEEGELKDTAYQDVCSSRGLARLEVCARDVWRLLDRFGGTKAASLDAFGLLQRLLDEQCDVVEQYSAADEDRAEGEAPVVVKNPKEVASDSLQSPHDPDVTYSGHKGKGYAVQVQETCHEENDVEIITHVDVTPACEADSKHTTVALDETASRNVQPDELIADAGYGSTENAIAAEARGVDLVAPVPGGERACEQPDAELTAVDFDIDPSLQRPGQCPCDVKTTFQEIKEGKTRWYIGHFPADQCAGCPLAPVCPTKPEGDVRTLKAALEPTIREQRRHRQQQPGFKETYRQRAGVEATNSELKRCHGLAKLRVRGLARVRLSVFLKTTAANFRRLLRGVARRAAAAAAGPAAPGLAPAAQ